MLNRFRLPAVVLLASALCPAQDSVEKVVDQVVERARQEFNVPGIAVAIVKDGNVVLAKGFGVRRQGESAPVTAQSLFRIASNTKAFTTAALAMLVDEGKIRWDDPVTQHMPGFQLYDPYVTREMTIRDLLTHRSGLGLGAGDLMLSLIHIYRRGRPRHGVRRAPAGRHQRHCEGAVAAHSQDCLLYTSRCV